MRHHGVGDHQSCDVRQCHLQDEACGHLDPGQHELHAEHVLQMYYDHGKKDGDRHAQYDLCDPSAASRRRHGVDDLLNDA